MGESYDNRGDTTGACAINDFLPPAPLTAAPRQKVCPEKPSRLWDTGPQPFVHGETAARERLLVKQTTGAPAFVRRMRGPNHAWARRLRLTAVSCRLVPTGCQT